MPTIDFNELRDQVREWSDRNFGINETKHHRPLLGMQEELGELIGAIERDGPESHKAIMEEVRDAIADMCIFGADYAARKDWDYERLLMSGLARTTYSALSIEPNLLQLAKYLGQMDHCQLKTEQGIRGDAAEHDERAQNALTQVFFQLNCVCKRCGWDLREVVSDVWATVSKRDFTKNKLTGEVAGGNPA